MDLGLEDVGLELHEKIIAAGAAVDAQGKLTDELKEKIESTINGEETNEKPGLRACGIQVDVQSATNVPISVEVTCSIYRTEDALAISEIKEMIEEEINKLGIHENVVWTSIILALRRISYVKDVSGLLINGVADNVKIGIDQIARFENAEITVESVQ